MTSYLSLLLSSQVRGLVKALGTHGEAEADILPAQAWPPGAEDGRDDCQLRSGIASMEHWLDLNA
jgi:hypothetical protein